MMATYAANTSVPVGQSQTEVENTLKRYGASKFMRGWDEDRAVIMFEFNRRQVQMVLPLPNRNEFRLTPTGKPRTSQNAIDEAYEQACRQRWHWS